MIHIIVYVLLFLVAMNHLHIFLRILLVWRWVSGIIMASSAALTPAQPYFSEELDKKRDIITQLYREESMRLQDLRIVLAQEHPFRST